MAVVAANAWSRQRRTQDRAPSRWAAALLIFTAVLLASNGVFAALYIQADSKQEKARSPGFSGQDRVAYRFYEALNDALASGDAIRLRSLLHPTFTEEPARAGLPAGVEGFLTSIEGTRSTTPNLRVAIETVMPNGSEGEFVVSLRTSGGDQPSFLGLRLPAMPAAHGWGPVETLRVVDGLIAKRQTWHGRSASFRELGTFAPSPLGDDFPRVLGLVRLVLPADAELAVLNDGVVRAHLVASGTLAVSRSAEPSPTGARPSPANVSDRPSVTAGGLSNLEPGTTFVTEPGEVYVLANDGADPLVLHTVVVRTVAPGPIPADAFADLVRFEVSEETGAATGEFTQEVLAVALAPSLRPGSFRVGQVVVPPTAAFDWTSSDRAVLLAVEHGGIDLVSDRPGTIGQRASGLPWAGRHARLGPGDCAYVEPGTSALARAPEEAFASLLVVTFEAQEPRNGDG